MRFWLLVHKICTIASSKERTPSFLLDIQVVNRCGTLASSFSLLSRTPCNFFLCIAARYIGYSITDEQNYINSDDHMAQRASHFRPGKCRKQLCKACGNFLVCRPGVLDRASPFADSSGLASLVSCSWKMVPWHDFYLPVLGPLKERIDLVLKSSNYVVRIRFDIIKRCIIGKQVPQRHHYCWCRPRTGLELERCL